MTEDVERWWERRQWSKGVSVPYAVGSYREEWQRYPVLIKQYHPDLNRGIALTQIPPAADVYLVWQCDTGHVFVATPHEQRNRPGRIRRRSSWCPECSKGALPTIVPARTPNGAIEPTPLPSRRTSGRGFRASKPHHDPTEGRPVGEPFFSPLAPKPSSAAEALLRQFIAERLEVELGLNAVRVARPFFERFEVWPDVVMPELRTALEYDTTGRDGLEHVGHREESDKRKDRLLRSAGWEVIRIRTGKLQPIGQYDLVASSVSAKLVDRILDRLGEIRGELIVRSYRRAHGD
jgi:hypothetical protein